MATLNRIGPYRLRNWLGPALPAIPNTVEVLSSRGLDYQAVRLLGKRSDEHQRQSIVDEVTIPLAYQLYQGYTDLIEGDSVQLIWNGMDYDAYGIRARVLSVELVEVKQKVFICGALFQGNTVDLLVNWRLLLVPYEAA